MLIFFPTVSSAVQSTTSELLNGNIPAQMYNLEVACDIEPSSTAEYCEVIVSNSGNTISGMHLHTCTYYAYVSAHQETLILHDRLVSKVNNSEEGEYLIIYRPV